MNDEPKETYKETIARIRTEIVQIITAEIDAARKQPPLRIVRPADITDDFI